MGVGMGGILFGDITGDHDRVSGQKQNQNQIFKAERNVFNNQTVSDFKGDETEAKGSQLIT